MYGSTSLSNTPPEHDPWKHSQTEKAGFSAADFLSSTPRFAAHASVNDVQIQLMAGTNAQPELEGHKQASFFVIVAASAFPRPERVDQQVTDDALALNEKKKWLARCKASGAA